MQISNTEFIQIFGTMLILWMTVIVTNEIFWFPVKVRDALSISAVILFFAGLAFILLAIWGMPEGSI